MKFNYCTNFKRIFLVGILFFSFQVCYSQQDSTAKPKSEFWKKVQFGGGLGLGIGNGFTNLSVSPTAYYNFDTKFAVGTGLTASYIAQKQNASNFNATGYKSTIFGASVIGLYNVIPEIQLSTEVEQLKVNTTFDVSGFPKQDTWNTALFLGGGYKTQNVTIGVRYNLLFNDKDSVYSQAWLPFVRVMF